MTSDLSPAEQFFFDNAEYSWRPGKETEDAGRRRSGIMLAFAETVAKAADTRFMWVPDRNGEHAKDPDGPKTCELCCLYLGDDPIPIASIGCVDDATPEYKRVIEAELALAVIDKLPVPFNVVEAEP